MLVLSYQHHRGRSSQTFMINSGRVESLHTENHRLHLKTYSSSSPLWPHQQTSKQRRRDSNRKRSLHLSSSTGMDKDCITLDELQIYLVGLHKSYFCIILACKHMILNMRRHFTWFSKLHGSSGVLACVILKILSVFVLVGESGHLPVYPFRYSKPSYNALYLL